jgi:transcriptional regulator of aroF, aroG, tyrA and aromatic amino acid transport
MNHGKISQADPQLKFLIRLAPLFQELIPIDVGITVTDTDTQLFYLPGNSGKLKIKPGDPVLADSGSMTSMLEDRLVVRRMERRLGHDYLGRAVPIKDRFGKIIGSFGTVEIVTNKSIVKNMIIGRSPQLISAYHQALRAARYDESVLIIGETGTGKEMFARLIVEESKRKEAPFVAVNCASITPTLFESEMFGYDTGAFTGAQRGGKQGYFEMAHKGTIFLDEIGDLDLNLQVKLLRVLETGKVNRVGGNRERSVDIRVIAASNQDLKAYVREKKFRGDLFFRLSSIIISIPPLRERKKDLPLYIDRIFSREKQTFKRESLTLSSDAHELLLSYDYPGNIRELENILRRAVITCEGDRISRSDIEEQLLRHGKLKDTALETNQFQIDRLDSIEKHVILEALGSFPTKTECARALGISRDTLYRKIRKFNLG